MRRLKKLIKGLKYRQKIYIGCLVLALSLILFFVITSVVEFSKNAKAQTLKEAEYTSLRVTSQIDERLDNLWQFYSYSALDDDILWMIENNVKYSDYQKYHTAQEILADSKIFGDYIKEYALINFKTKWVLSNKGMYTLKESQNIEHIMEIYNFKKNIADRNYWYYDDSAERIEKVSRDYRVTISTEGLNIIIKIISPSKHSEGMLLVNLNMEVWEKWIDDMIDENDIVIVTDGEKVIFSSRPEIDTNAIVGQKAADESSSCFCRIDNEDYAQAVQKSKVLGWNYYVFRKIPSAYFPQRGLITIIIAITLISFLCIVLGYFIYNPVRNLVKDIAGDEENDRLDMDEIDYLTNSFEGIKSDRLKLQEKVIENKRKIQELFELRLIRGEVKYKEEWKEYFKGLNIEPCSHFATIVMIINLRDIGADVEIENNLNEDSMCISLLESLPRELDEMTWMPLVYNACAMFGIFGEEDEDTLLKRISSFADDFNKYAIEKIGFGVILGISATHTNPQHIYAAYRESVSALTMNKGGLVEDSSGQGELRYYLNSMTNSVNKHDFSLDKQLSDAIKAADKEQCYHIIDTFSKSLEELGSMDEKIFLTTRIINAALETAKNTRLNLNEVFPSGVRKLYRDICEVAETKRVRRYLKAAVVDPIIKARLDSLENDTTTVLEKIEDVIVESNGNITLVECADKLGLSQNDIWKILKMEKDISFSELTELYKLEKAKELLLETDYSVNKISDFLGYSNAQNFIRFFSRSTGLTPGKYRQLQ